MSLDFSTLSLLRKTHPAWRLLIADHAPLIAGFLHRVFIVPNVRVIPEGDLISRLEDDLFRLRETEGVGSFPRSAVEYLDEWARNDKGWLRKYYPPDSDEAHYDLTPAVEKALGWLEGLTQRMFVGTESRLMTIFELLRQMVAGVETDAETRIRELEQRRDEIDRQIERIRTGDLEVLDETSLKDRFQQRRANSLGISARWSTISGSLIGMSANKSQPGTAARAIFWSGFSGKGTRLPIRTRVKASVLSGIF
jgi:hypothetical protein